MTAVAVQPFHYVQERDDPFLALFPHRFDFIYAAHPQPGQRPDWRTECRYPLSDRVILQGESLFGVRFGKTTRYCLLDIDIGSPFHPQHDPFAISRISTALEAIGLTTHVACSSSYSGGLHLYFPFPDPQPSWKIAAVVAAVLEKSGFQLKPGQLELFPNYKPFRPGQPSLFNAHRLPLQLGSYLVNKDFQPVWTDPQRFVQQWRFAETCNVLNSRLIERLIRQSRQQIWQISGRAAKFLNDLNIEIEEGWTEHGQTNRLLGRIAMRTYIFHHVLEASEPLAGEKLAQQIVAIAQSLPGYSEWCRHQHELENRAIEWARCVENSRYTRYGSTSSKRCSDLGSDRSENSWNQTQSQKTRDRIKQAIADLLEKNALPIGITERFKALIEYGIGGGSLYRHRDLWHPQVLNPQERSATCLSLLPSAGGNDLPCEDCSDSETVQTSIAGRNLLSAHPPRLFDWGMRKPVSRRSGSDRGSGGRSADPSAGWVDSC